MLPKYLVLRIFSFLFFLYYAQRHLLLKLQASVLWAPQIPQSSILKAVLRIRIRPERNCFSGPDSIRIWIRPLVCSENCHQKVVDICARRLVFKEFLKMFVYIFNEKFLGFLGTNTVFLSRKDPNPNSTRPS